MVTVADTAFSIAILRAEEGRRPENERLFEDPYAALFQCPGDEVREAAERFAYLPFFREGVRLRTRGIDDAVREAMAAGSRQVVLLGVGFDCRGLRMPELRAEGVTVYEVDFADQLERKRAYLSGGGVELPPSIVYAACDFNAPGFEEALAERLEERGFRRGQGAVFVWEGVIDYIDNKTADRTLAFMRHVGGPGTWVVLTHGLDRFEPETTVDHLKRLGFTSGQEVGFDDLWRLHWGTEPPPVAAMGRVTVAVV